MAKQYRFLLLAGAHHDLLTRTLYQFVPGNLTIVPSTQRLDQVHPTKFRLLDRRTDPLAVPEDGDDDHRDLIQRMGFQPVEKEVPKGIDLPVQEAPFIIADEPADLSQVPNQPQPDFGTEVTADCDRAVLHHLRVWRRKGRLFVTPKDNPKEIVCAEGGYTGMAAVSKAIDKYTATHHTAPV